MQFAFHCVVLFAERITEQKHSIFTRNRIFGYTRRSILSPLLGQCRHNCACAIHELIGSYIRRHVLLLVQWPSNGPDIDSTSSICGTNHKMDFIGTWSVNRLFSWPPTRCGAHLRDTQTPEIDAINVYDEVDSDCLWLNCIWAVGLRHPIRKEQTSHRELSQTNVTIINLVCGLALAERKINNNLGLNGISITRS